MKHLVGLLAAGTVAAVALGSSNASADILASIANSQFFQSQSSIEVVIPIGSNGAKQLKFTTAAASTRVKITYNATCEVAAVRGRYVSIRILVDGVETKPFDAGDAALCSALDVTGENWASVSRQALLTVSAGDHHVKVVGRLAPSAPEGDFTLDESSLVVEK